MPQLNIYYGKGQVDRELMEHLQVIKRSGGQISTWVKEACLMRLRAENPDTTEDKLDRILEKLERLESRGLVIPNGESDTPPSDQADIDDFFKSATESFE